MRGGLRTAEYPVPHVQTRSALIVIEAWGQPTQVPGSSVNTLVLAGH